VYLDARDATKAAYPSAKKTLGSVVVGGDRLAAVCMLEARVAHRPSSSTTRLGDRRRFFQERNRLWSAFRNEPPSVIARALWLSVRRLRHPPRGTHSTALVAGVAGAPVRLFERWRRIS
jgi:hypothetical protein